MSMCRCSAACVVVGLCFSMPCLATDIEGVQPASLDQPRVNVLLRRDPAGKPLVTTGADAAGKVFNVEAFLDTGASGFVLSANTAKALGIRDRKSTRLNQSPCNIVCRLLLVKK